MPQFTSQHFAILGAGRSGLGAARLARLHGAEVTVFDEGDPSKIQGALDKLHAESFRTVSGLMARELVVKAGDFQRVIISPGLDASWPLPKKFTDVGVPLEGEMEFAFNLTDMPMVSGGDSLRIRCTYDNTLDHEGTRRALEDAGLDAPVDVYLGEGTLDEMCIGMFGYVY